MDEIDARQEDLVSAGITANGYQLGDVVAEMTMEIGNLIVDDPETAKDVGKMLTTADAVVVFVPVLRRHIAVCEATRTRWLGNGYVVYDSRRRLWKRNINITDKYLPATNELREALREIECAHPGLLYREERTSLEGFAPLRDINGDMRTVIYRAKKSLEMTRRSSGAFRNVVSSAKPLLIRPTEWFVAQTFQWLLDLKDEHGEVLPWKMSELSDLNSEAGHIGGVDWDRTVAPILRRLGLVVNPSNRPTVRLDRDDVREALVAFIAEHQK